VRAILCAAACAACVATTQPKFPDDVAAGVRSGMRRMETDTFIIYYPAARHDEAMRFADRAEGCGASLRSHAELRNHFFREKPILVLPDVPFNNAFVSPPVLGEEDFAVIPLHNTFDFATELGIPPDPGYIACHELTHYTHEMQIGGLWYAINTLFGAIGTPQGGLDSWFWEGLAVHYEMTLQPNAGRPRWPIFTGMFAAAYAGGRLETGDLSELNREPPPGGNYLVGGMFVDFLARKYGEDALWRVIALQAYSWTIVIGVNDQFAAAFGKSIGALFEEFKADTAARFPVRVTPADQRHVRGGSEGDDARYARGLDGTEAVVGSDVDVPVHLDVFGPDGGRRARVLLVDVVPPRTLVTADPILTSGLSITRAGDVYFTMIDQGATYQVPRLLRWRAAHPGSIEEVASGLGPGACVSPDGATYYYLIVDGDRWSLGAYDLATGARRVVRDLPPGQYVLAAQPSPDGRTLIASVWDGRFSAWVIDAATGEITARIHGAGDTPVYDGAFVDDARVVYLAEEGGRFQAAVRDLATGATQIATDAPYAVLNARPAGGALRFLSRRGWEWDLDEVALPAPGGDVAAPSDEEPAPPATATPHIFSDTPYSAFDHLFAPTLHTLALYQPASGTTIYGASLAGSDRLGHDRWAIAGYVEPDTRELSGQASFLNARLAPWYFAISADVLHWTETDDMVRVHRQQRDAQASFGRTWRNSWSAFVRALSSELHDRATGFAPFDVRLAGPGVSLAYSGFDATPYAGPRRGGALAIDAAWYPASAAQPAVEVTDLRGQLDLAAPVPFTLRHTLHVSLVGRAVRSDTDGLLQLGGESSLAFLYTRSSDRALPTFAGPETPPLVTFEEALRGYEDYPLTTDRAAIGNVSWRWPLIVDRGAASTFYLFPASFLREFDLEVFASAAVDESRGGRREHAAGGVAVSAQVSAFRIPLTLTYQVARRLSDDDAWTQLIGVGEGF
jgi:hypothetical protein